jgi:CelD/BcsL family acetyltransferase involved in cellulose biosynthesis
VTAPRASWVADPAAFAALAPRWRELCAASARPSVFASHAWLDSAWAWAKQSSAPRILLLGHDAATAGAAALALSNESLAGLPFRTLHWLEIPDTQDCDLLCAPGGEVAAATAMLDALLAERGAWDKLRLGRLDDDSVVRSTLPALLEARRVAYRFEQVDANPYVDLAGDWDGFQAALTRSFKKKLNLARNRLAKLGATRVANYGAPDGEVSAEDAFAALKAISAKSWKRATGTTLDQPGPAAFAERLAARFAGSGQLQVWLLYLDGRVVATELQLVQEKKVHALRSDFDPELEDASPGTNLSVEILRRLFASNRGGRYLLGPGANAYKQRWTDKALPLYELTAYSPTARGRARYLLEQKVRPAARRLRDRMRKPQAAPAAETE